MNTSTARIIQGVPGPSGEPGILLQVPPSEALDWDLQDEVASTSRYWMADRQAWWVARPYAATAVAIVSRVHGIRDEVEEVGGAARVAVAMAAPTVGWWTRLRTLLTRTSTAT